MLKLTLKPGEYIDIGENIRVVFSGGSANNIHLLIEAPKEVSVARSNALANKDRKQQYYTDDAISAEAQREIADILMKEKRKHEPKKVTAGMGKRWMLRKERFLSVFILQGWQESVLVNSFPNGMVFSELT